jgi:hypothetical protein
MKNLNQLKPAFIAVAFLLTVTVLNSCKRDDVAPNPNQVENNGFASRQANTAALINTCGTSNLQENVISLSYAYQLVRNYQEVSKSKGGLCNTFDNGTWVLSETFPAEAVQSILNQRGCCKFRIYNGLDTDNRLHLVMVGVNSLGSDILFCNSTTGSTSDACANIGDLGLIVEMGNPCPQSCSGSYVAP